MRKRKLSSLLRQSFRKLKYLDKTQTRYFALMSFLIGFCLFAGTTYSYFTFSKKLNAATISIARLSYNLSSPTSGYQNGQIAVPANGSVTLDLNLSSQNSTETKYALRYTSADPNIKVYYSESLANNMTGIIGPLGSNISMRVIIENKGTADATVNFTVNGGYIQNTLETNITEGFYEADIVVRSILLADDLSNGIVDSGFPTKGSGYAYFRTTCTGPATAKWDEENWKLNLDDIQGKISCDAFFKQVSNDIEVVLAVKKKDGTIEYVESVPNDGTYTFDKAECSTGATPAWDTAAWKLDVTNITEKTICTGYFNEN